MSHIYRQKALTQDNNAELIIRETNAVQQERKERKGSKMSTVYSQAGREHFASKSV